MQTHGSDTIAQIEDLCPRLANRGVVELPFAMSSISTAGGNRCALQSWVHIAICGRPVVVDQFKLRCTAVISWHFPTTYSRFENSIRVLIEWCSSICAYACLTPNTVHRTPPDSTQCAYLDAQISLYFPTRPLRTHHFMQLNNPSHYREHTRQQDGWTVLAPPPQETSELPPPYTPLVASGHDWKEAALNVEREGSKESGGWLPACV
ncbi:hypothetical protein FB451DRAFT_1382522 [Mycena latifolia]|nr:hypothetical protein FB451DRAFT_1382522 [Mycena latifolia]